MDAFDMERLQAYRRKVFNNEQLTGDQVADWEDLKKRHAEVEARRVMREEREEVRRQAEAERKMQRELFQQQRELLLLSRRPVTKQPVKDYNDLPRVVSVSSKLLPGISIDCPPFSPVQSGVVSVPSPVSEKVLTRITSVPKLYASPKRTPTSVARAETLALRQQQRDDAAHQRLVEEELARKKLEKRRMNSMSRRYSNNMSMENQQNASVVNNAGENDDDNANTNAISSRSLPEVTNNHCSESQLIHDSSMRATYPARSNSAFTASNNNFDSAQGREENNQANETKSPLTEPEYIQTYDVMLCDVKGPLGEGCGGMRRYFQKLLESFVATGCIYRTSNKIGICVHGTSEALDVVEKVMNHAAKNPVTTSFDRGNIRSRRPDVKWKFRSTGRTLRRGNWRNRFVTRLCENAQGGKYSPKHGVALM